MPPIGRPTRSAGSTARTVTEHTHESHSRYFLLCGASQYLADSLSPLSVVGLRRHALRKTSPRALHTKPDPALYQHCHTAGLRIPCRPRLTDAAPAHAASTSPEGLLQSRHTASSGQRHGLSPMLATDALPSSRFAEGSSSGDIHGYISPSDAASAAREMACLPRRPPGASLPDLHQPPDRESENHRPPHQIGEIGQLDERAGVDGAERRAKSHACPLWPAARPSGYAKPRLSGSPNDAAMPPTPPRSFPTARSVLGE